jgi:hypothetical protein
LEAAVEESNPPDDEGGAGAGALPKLKLENGFAAPESAPPEDEARSDPVAAPAEEEGVLAFFHLLSQIKF